MNIFSNFVIFLAALIVAVAVLAAVVWLFEIVAVIAGEPVLGR